MSYTISRRFRFEAMHSLPSLPEGHKCRRPHGHSYIVWLELKRSELDEHGFVRDYGDLWEFRRDIEALDHRNVDDFITPSSAEVLCRWLFGLAETAYPGDVVAVRVSETENTWAEYRP